MDDDAPSARVVSAVQKRDGEGLDNNHHQPAPGSLPLGAGASAARADGVAYRRQFLRRGVMESSTATSRKASGGEGADQVAADPALSVSR
jgi:hypothetical protein